MKSPSRARLHLLLAVAMFGTAALTACHSPSTVTLRPGASNDAMTAVPAPVGEPAENTAGPMDRDAIRAREFAAAIAGLTFENEFVSVDAPPAFGDLDIAGRFMDEGRAEMASNHRTRAVAAWASAVRAAPGHAPAYAGLAMALRGKGKTDLAVAAWRTAVDLDPADAESRYQLGLELSMTQRWADSIAEMDALLRLDPSQGRAHERLAVWHYYLDDFGRAWEHVHAARELGARVPPQLVNLLRERMAEPAG